MRTYAIVLDFPPAYRGSGPIASFVEADACLSKGRAMGSGHPPESVLIASQTGRSRSPVNYGFDRSTSAGSHASLSDEWQTWNKQHFLVNFKTIIWILRNEWEFMENQVTFGVGREACNRQIPQKKKQQNHTFTLIRLRSVDVTWRTNLNGNSYNRNLIDRFDF